jgi:hypothetical protein
MSDVCALYKGCVLQGILIVQIPLWAATAYCFYRMSQFCGKYEMKSK